MHSDIEDFLNIKFEDRISLLIMKSLDVYCGLKPYWNTLITNKNFIRMLRNQVFVHDWNVEETVKLRKIIENDKHNSSKTQGYSTTK